MKKTTKTLTTLGTALASSFAASAVNAESNPFAMTELSSGYMQLAQADKAEEMQCGSKMKMDKKTEAACGEGKCGSMMANGKMKKGLEQSCGAMMKGKEGACGDLQEKASTGKVKNKGFTVNKSGWGNKKASEMKKMDMSKDMDMKSEMNRDKGMQGMCGGMMQDGKMKQGMEHKCGAMMKGKEGMCGMSDMKGMDMKGKEASCGVMVTPEQAAGK
ncbi:MAG: hypothetical protein RQ733_11925 [Methyloprofundus sp.]|nr:hypothetical protein [Methyloprofundus sp.]MDT8426666.1 hypothetical protein [Methyloprofundus sp.]